MSKEFSEAEIEISGGGEALLRCCLWSWLKPAGSWSSKPYQEVSLDQEGLYVHRIHPKTLKKCIGLFTFKFNLIITVSLLLNLGMRCVSGSFSNSPSGHTTDDAGSPYCFGSLRSGKLQFLFIVYYVKWQA